MNEWQPDQNRSEYIPWNMHTILCVFYFVVNKLAPWDWCDIFTHIIQDCFIDTGAMIWSNHVDNSYDITPKPETLSEKILGLLPANERLCYFVIQPLNNWAQT